MTEQDFDNISRIKSEVSLLNEKISSLRVEAKKDNETIRELLSSHNALALERNQALLNFLTPLSREVKILGGKVVEIDKRCAERGISWKNVNDHLEDEKVDKRKKKDNILVVCLAAGGWLIALLTQFFAKRHGP